MICNLIQIVKVYSVSKMSRSAASDLDLHCLLMSHKKENRLKLFSNQFIPLKSILKFVNLKAYQEIFFSVN